MLVASYLAAAARRGSGKAVSFRSFSAVGSISTGSSRNKGGGSNTKQQQRRRPSSSPPPPPLPGNSSAPPPPPPLPVVVLLGRPNVGKSALFNRLTGSRQVLVRDTPGSHVTRDWRGSEAGKLGDLRFEVVDTSGLEEPAATRGGGRGSGSSSSSSSSSSSLEDGLGSRAASLTAGLLRSRADVALLLLDAKDGVTPVDEALARWLRRSGAVVVPSLDSAAAAADDASASAFDAVASSPDPSSSYPRPPAAVFVAVNKAEAARSNPGVAAAVAEAGRLGFGEGVGISAETGEGMAELYAALAPTLDRAAARLLLLQEEDLEAGRGEEEEAEREEGGERRKGGGPMRVAIVGAPNAGKSTLSNALLGSERSLTGPEPGLTRDAVWATLEWTPPQEKRREEEGKAEEEGGGEEEGASSSSSSSPSSSSSRRSSPRPRPRIVELIDTAGWDRRTARTASIAKRNDDKDDNDDQGGAGRGGKGSKASTAATTAASSPASSAGPSSSSSSSPASTLLAPADVIAEAMRQTERGINLAHVTVVVVDLAAAAARANPSSAAAAAAAPGEGGDAAAVP